MSKVITFSEYKFHLLPYEEKDPTFEFDGPKPNPKNLVEKKNSIFQTILESIDKTRSDKNLFKLLDSENGIYLYKISNRKFTKYVDNFEKKELKTEPYIYLIIDNRPDKEKIYISEDALVFKTVNGSKNILVTVFRRHLHKQYLNIDVTEVFDKKNFWTIAKDNQNKISYINIEIIKPNIETVTRSLYSTIQNFAGKTNSYISNILLKAPEKGTLKNIDPSNKDLDLLVEHSSLSGGAIKIKVIGTRKQINTNSSIKKVHIDEDHLENIDEKLMKVYLEIIKEN